MKPYYIVIIFLAILTVTLCSCKKAVNGNNLDNSFADTTSLNTDAADDSILDSNYKLTDYDTPPTPVQNPMPKYPDKFRNSGIQGVVVLEVEVLENGTVGEVKVMRSLLATEGGLDDTAVTAVKNWVFKPAMLDKKAVVSRVNIPISFSLKAK